MNDNENNKNTDEEEKTVIRHKINAEETFTLAKDVYDLRCVIKNIYANRAVILRRLNIITMTFSLLFTLLYVGYMLGTGLFGKLSLGGEIASFVLLGVYAAVFATLIIVALCGSHAHAKNVRTVKRALKIIRLIVRLLSIVITVAALVSATDSAYAAQSVALNVVLIIFSVLSLLVQLLALLCGGTVRLARWLLSPVKIKYRFPVVAVEWYGLVTAGDDKMQSVKKVSKKYVDSTGKCLDGYIIPSFGNKYITSIKPAAVLAVAEAAPEEEKRLTEGVLKSVFAYAEECGYIAENPCRDLDLKGSIEDEKRPRRTLKDRLMGLGKRVGKSMLDKYVLKPDEDD